MYRYATRTSQQMTVLCQTSDSPEHAPATPSSLLPPATSATSATQTPCASAVSRHLDPDRAYRIGDHGLGGGAVARVRGPAVLGFLVLGAAQVLGHLLVQGRLRHASGELSGSPSGPVRSSPFSLAMRTNVSAASRSALRFSASGFFVGVMFPHCPSRHRPPAFPTGHTTGQLRPVTHFERQSPSWPFESAGAAGRWIENHNSFT